MPPPRKYQNNAERQKAHRARVKARKLAALEPIDAVGMGEKAAGDLGYTDGLHKGHTTFAKLLELTYEEMEGKKMPAAIINNIIKLQAKYTEAQMIREQETIFEQNLRVIKELIHKIVIPHGLENEFYAITRPHMSGDYSTPWQG